MEDKTYEDGLKKGYDKAASLCDQLGDSYFRNGDIKGQKALEEAARRLRLLAK